MHISSQPRLSIEPTAYLHWPEAYRCRSGELELTVVASIGPRILSLRRAGGQNLLVLDPADFRVGNWRLYGGHRFTTAPEDERSYAPDNAACDVHVGKERLTLTSDAPRCGVQKQVEISALAEDEGFVLRHTLTNTDERDWRGAPWAITCVSTTGKIILPRPAFRTLPPRPVRFWSGPANDYAGASSPQWVDRDGYFLIRPDGRRGKIGVFSACPWLAWIGGDTVFYISCPHLESPEAYPDDGCNLEVFTCPDYLELEHLGPLVTLSSGNRVVLEEHWRVLPVSLDCEDWSEIRRLCEPRLNVIPRRAAVPATATTEPAAALSHNDAMDLAMAAQPQPARHG
jgi:hypothetical protein